MPSKRNICANLNQVSMLWWPTVEYSAWYRNWWCADDGARSQPRQEQVPRPARELRTLSCESWWYAPGFFSNSAFDLDRSADCSATEQMGAEPQDWMGLDCRVVNRDNRECGNGSRWCLGRVEALKSCSSRITILDSIVLSSGVFCFLFPFAQQSLVYWLHIPAQ